MKLGSLFDGIGGFPLAASRYGITPAWASEIEEHCIDITKKHFPYMKHLGNIGKINGYDIEPVDIISFGSPCQDLSIAGTRQGLKGNRSGLFEEAIRIIYEMKGATNDKYPTWAIWENVPGALSSSNGDDFCTVLKQFTKTKIPMPKSRKWANAGLVRSEVCNIAWRILDAQYWGVPQRRRRVFLVADFRRERAGKVLFKQESKRGDIEETKNAREENKKRVGRSLAAGFNGWRSISGSIEYCEERSPCLQQSMPSDVVIYPNKIGTLCASGAGMNRPVGQGNELDFCLCLASSHKNAEITTNVVPTLVCAHEQPILFRNNYVVRRLTPLECERAQGFPDYWTEGVSDTKRYMSLGNSVAIPCVEYIMKNILEESKHD